MKRADDKKSIIEEIQVLKDERMIDAIMELLAFGKKYRNDNDNKEDHLLNESKEEYIVKPSDSENKSES